MIEAIEGKGVNRANAVCDECARKEPVTCDYNRSPGGEWKPNEGQVKKKITAHGWAEVKGKLYCQMCDAKRKVVQMKPKEQEPAPVPEMTKREKIEIFTMLADVYDIDAGCYKNNDTDETVADVLGVRPGWVAQVRDAEFGPAGGNEEMAALQVTLDECGKAYADLRHSLEATEKEIGRIGSDMKAQKARMDSALSRLAAIQKAVGPRIMKRAQA